MVFERLSECIERHYDSAVVLRRHIHAHPEVSLSERKTTECIRRYLTYPGIQLEDMGTETGLCALVEGARPGKTALLRADIDALPVQERTDLPFRSVNGACHCCGHDIHTATVALCARVIADVRDEMIGSVRFLFQPAEETMEGARLCLEAGITERPPKVEYALSLHCSNLTEAGKVALISGPAAAGADRLRILVKGTGGHVVHPHTSVDPISPACAIVLHLRILMAQEIDPFVPAVLGIGSIHGGVADNMIPETVVIEGTLRTFDTALRNRILGRIEEIVRDTARAYGAEGSLIVSGHCPTVVHDPAMTEQMAATVRDLLGPDELEFMQRPAMGSEDFGFFAERLPVLQIRLGTGSDQPGGRLGVHNPAVVFREDAIRTGAAVLTAYLTKACQGNGTSKSQRGA